MKKQIVMSLLVLFVGSPALARLAPPSPEAKAKADETAAKAAWTTKADAYKVCLSQDRVVAHYRASASAAGKAAPAGLPTPPCADPGPFAYNPQPKPIEASGAHSPADTAAKPPSTPAPAAQTHPTPKSQ